MQFYNQIFWKISFFVVAFLGRMKKIFSWKYCLNLKRKSFLYDTVSLIRETSVVFVNIKSELFMYDNWRLKDSFVEYEKVHDAINQLMGVERWRLLEIEVNVLLQNQVVLIETFNVLNEWVSEPQSA